MRDQNNLYASDKELVNKVLRGDRGAFATIIKNTEALVTTIVFKMIQDNRDREDLVQDIFLKAYHNLPGFRHEAKLSTWIGQIAYHTCLHHIEKKRPIPVEAHEETISKDQASFSNSTGQWLYRKDLAGILKTETAKLPPLYQTLLTLFHLEEMSVDEIKQITGLPEGTIKSYLYRARIQLKERLLSNYEKEDL